MATPTLSTAVNTDHTLAYPGYRRRPPGDGQLRNSKPGWNKPSRFRKRYRLRQPQRKHRSLTFTSRRTARQQQNIILWVYNNKIQRSTSETGVNNNGRTRAELRKIASARAHDASHQWHHSLSQSRSQTVTCPVKRFSMLSFCSPITGQICTCDHCLVLLNETPIS